MDILKDNIGIIGIFCVIIITVSIFFWSKPTKQVEAQSNKLIGETNTGIVYIDTDTIETVKKDEIFYLIVSAEEHYKESSFLTELRKDEDLKDTISSMTLYMFTSDGRYYCTPQKYLIDSEGKVCGDLGSDMNLKVINDKIIAEIYTSALKTLEDKDFKI